jgi:hypothetical protein
MHQRGEQDHQPLGLQTEVVGREVFDAVDFVNQFTPVYHLVSVT